MSTDPATHGEMMAARARPLFAVPIAVVLGGWMVLAAVSAGRATPAPAATGRPAGSSQRVAELQERLADLQVNVGFLGQQMKSADGRIRSLERKVAARRADADKTQTELTQLETQQAAEASETVQLERELADTETRCRQIRERFKAWLVRLHKVRQGTLVTTLFSAGDLNAFLARYQLIRHLLRHDHQLLAELTALENELFVRRESLAARKQRLAQLAATAEATRGKLATELNGLVGLLNSLVLERKVYQKRQKALQDDLAALERQIATVEGARQSSPERFDAALDTPDPGTSSGEGSTPNLQTCVWASTGTGSAGRGSPGGSTRTGVWASTGTRVGGPATGTIVVGPPSVPGVAPKSLRFAWPVASLVRSQVANSDTAGGLELPISGDGQILAAERGKVLFRGPMGRLGNIVIIAHKNGYSTVYGHLDEIWVGMGQILNRGEPLGRIAPVSRQRLHFEIRLCGRGETALSLLPKL